MVPLHRHLSELLVAPVARYPPHQSGPAHWAVLDRRALAISVLVRAWRVQLPYSHHQRKQRLFRFLSNTGFDTMTVQTALLAPICQAARCRARFRS